MNKLMFPRWVEKLKNAFEDLDPQINIVLKEIENRQWGDTTFESWLSKIRERSTNVGIDEGKYNG